MLFSLLDPLLQQLKYNDFRKVSYLLLLSKVSMLIQVNYMYISGMFLGLHSSSFIPNSIGKYLEFFTIQLLVQYQYTMLLLVLYLTSLFSLVCLAWRPKPSIYT